MPVRPSEMTGRHGRRFSSSATRAGLLVAAVATAAIVSLLGLALNFSVIMSRQAAQITRLAQERALEKAREQARSAENGGEPKRERL